MKTIKILSLILVFIFAIHPLYVYADYKIESFEEFEISGNVLNDGEWFYQLEEIDKTATIYAYNGKDLNAVIPEVVENDYKVTTLSLESECITRGGLPTHFPVFNTQIESLTIPKTLELITRTKDERYYENNLENDILEHCDKTIVFSYFHCGNLQNLKLITVEPENPYFSSQNGVLYNKDKTVLISYPPNKIGSKYTIPKTVTQIMDYAFSPISLSLKEIIITENVEKIGRNNVFNNDTTNLEKIVLLNNVLNENQLKNIFSNELLDIKDENLIPTPIIVTVYENSPAHKYYARRENLNIIDNPDIEKADKKETTSQKTNSKNKSEASKPYESAPSDTAESIISKPVESVTTETNKSEETLTIGATENNTDTTPKAKPEKSNKVWIIISAAVLLAGGSTTYWFIRKKTKA